MVEPSTETTIGEGRAYLNSQLDRGKAAKCPCCTQTVKVYKRKLNAGMSRALICIYREGIRSIYVNDNHRPYLHVGTLLTNQKINAGNTEYSKLAYWGLIEEMPKDPADTHKKTSGQWRLTNLGKAFVEDRAKVSEYVEVFNKRVLRPGGTHVSIRDTLGREFDYAELMRS